MSDDKSIFDKLQTPYDKRKLLEELEKELYTSNQLNNNLLINFRKDTDRKNTSVIKSKKIRRTPPSVLKHKNKFHKKLIKQISDHFSHNETMIQAEFYHWCKLFHEEKCKNME